MYKVIKGTQYKNLRVILFLLRKDLFPYVNGKLLKGGHSYKLPVYEETKQSPTISKIRLVYQNAPFEALERI